MSSRLVEAIRARRPSADIACPRTGLPLRIVVLAHHTRQEAIDRARQQWVAVHGDSVPDTETATGLGAAAALDAAVTIAVLAASVIDAETGAPVGEEVIREYDGLAIAALERWLTELEDNHDPRAETWTVAEVEAILEAVKKNDPSTLSARSLRMLGSGKLASFITTLGRLQETRETLTSCTSGLTRLLLPASATDNRSG